MKAAFAFVFLCVLHYGVIAKTFDIVNQGAKAHGNILNTIAIQKTIDACTNGDTVLIPAGKFITGTLHLKSNITVFLEKEAILTGSSNLKDYESYTLPGQVLTYYGILFTNGASNITITGKGTIDGNNATFFDFTKTSRLDTALTHYTRQKGNYRNALTGISDGPVVGYERPQHMIGFVGCKNIQIQNIALLNSLNTSISFSDCDGVKIFGARIWSGLNIPTSGIEISSCKNIIINGCDIRSGNDAIAITGFNDKLPVAVASTIHQSENVTISNCNLQSSSTGISISSLNKSSVTNVNVSYVNITNASRGIGLILRNEGSLQNMAFSNLYIETKLRTGNWSGNGEPIQISAVPGKALIKLGVINNISFSNISCIGQNHILLYGSKESLIQDVQFNDLLFKLQNSLLNEVAGGNIELRHNADPPLTLFGSNIPAFMARYVSGLTISNIKVSWAADIAQPFFTDGIEVSNFKGFKLSGYTIQPAPANVTAHAVSLIDGSLAMVEPGDVKRVRVIEGKAAKPVINIAKKKVVHR